MKVFDIKLKERVKYNPSGNNSSYDFQVWNEANQVFIPCICGHGGSDWLCNECSAKFYFEWKYNTVNLSYEQKDSMEKLIKKIEKLIPENNRFQLERSWDKIHWYAILYAVDEKEVRKQGTGSSPKEALKSLLQELRQKSIV